MLYHFWLMALNRFFESLLLRLLPDNMKSFYDERLTCSTKSYVHLSRQIIMSKIITCAVILFATTAIAAKAQQQPARAPQAAKAAYAYARGNDSYIRFADKSYTAGKKYIVFKLWNAKEALTEIEKKEMEALKINLANKNAEVVYFEWNDERDLKDRLKEYNLRVKVSETNTINLKGENFNLNTTSAKALFVLEDDKPVSVCSGKNCEDYLKRFFKIISTD